MKDDTRRRFNLLERRIERLERLVGPLDDSYEGRVINSGDWLNLESVCVGDIVGGVEIRHSGQVDILNKAGEEIKKYD
jgi:hypothetical protein